MELAVVMIILIVLFVGAVLIYMWVARETGGSGGGEPTPSVTNWNIYPDYIFSKGCSVRVQYDVSNATSDNEIQLKVSSMGVISTESSLDTGYMGDSEIFQGGRPGLYEFELFLDGELKKSHTVTVLNPPVDSIEHLLMYVVPSDLLPTWHMETSFALTNLRTEGFLPDEKSEKIISAIVLCTKYVNLVAIGFVSQPHGGEWSESISIDLKYPDGSFRPIGTVKRGERVEIEGSPAIVVNGMQVVVKQDREDTSPKYNHGDRVSFKLELFFKGEG